MWKIEDQIKMKTEASHLNGEQISSDDESEVSIRGTEGSFNNMHLKRYTIILILINWY